MHRKSTIEYRKTSELKPHPLNAEIYGDGADNDLVKSIEKNNVMEPLLIKDDGTIISGHRRRNAAEMVRLELVPVAIMEFEDELEEQEAVIHNNRQRKKTTEVKAREFAKLEDIEAERLARNKAHGLTAPGKTLEENFPQASRAPQARDIAAKKVGFGSGRTAEKAARVVNKIDELREKGENEKANNLKNKLNKTVDGAYREVTKTKKQKAPKQHKEKHFLELLPKEYHSQYNDLFNTITILKRDGWPGTNEHAITESIEAIIDFINS